MDNILKMNEVTDKDMIINVHHIGGIGECGPTDIISYFKDSILWYFYDADKDSLEDISIKNLDEKTNKKYKLINKCIGGKDGKAKFNILNNTSASSVLLPAKSAENYVIGILKNKPITWGEHTKLKKTIDIDMHKLDTLIEQKEIGQVDFLSIDAQGLDYEIIEGMDKNISSVVGVLCEVEFSQLYEGQKLFADIDIKLREKGFRFSTMYNPQIFNHMHYPKCQKDRGFLTVAEVLYLRSSEPLFDELKQDISEEEKKKIVIQLIKLAGLSLMFEQFSFSYDIIDKLEKMNLASIKNFSVGSNHEYIKMLNELKEGTLKITFLKYDEKLPNRN